MGPYVHREIDDVFEVLESAFAMRKRMMDVATSREHIQSIKSIILEKVGRLCELLRGIRRVKPAASEPETMAYLERVQEVKINLHAVS